MQGPCNATLIPSIYQPLPPGDWIRCATIDLKEFTRTGRVKCCLLPKRLSLIEGSYAAISYTWIGSRRRRLISLNGVEFFVSEHLYTAIEAYLRFCISDRENLEGKIRPPLLIWADALCINQSSTPDALAERAHQVKLMTEIFSSALVVFVDLGDTDKMEDLWCLLLKCPNKLSPDGIVNCLRRLGLLASEDMLSEWRTRMAFKILSRPWFSRVWIIQEYALPRSLVLIRLGPITINDSAFVDHLFQLLVCQDLCPPISNFSPPKTVHNLFRLRLTQKGLMRRAPFSIILSNARWYNSTDPRDKVYGCLGFSPKAFRSSFVVDYHEDIESLCCRITKKLIQHESTLDILLSAKFLHCGKGPSWAYHCDIHDEVSFLTSSDSDEMPRHETLFQSFGPHRDAVLTKQTETEITLMGCVVDSIRVIQPLPWSNRIGNTIIDEDLARMLYAEIQVFYREQVRCRSGTAPDADLFNSLWRMLLEDEVYQPTHQWWQTPNRKLARRGVKICRAQAHHGLYFLCFLAKMQRSIDKLPEIYQSIVRELSKVFTRHLKPIEPQPWCLTAAGRVGRVPKKTQLGDKVAIMAGGRAPYVVRPQGQCYALVGPCYVQGLMNGEAFQRPSSGNRVQMPQLLTEIGLV